jgi:uncharacterized integral membrane protein
MIFLLILGVILGSVSVIFALQNIDVTTVSFFTWQFEGSLTLILLAALLSGIFISLLILLPGSIRNYFIYRKLKKENKRLEEELRKQKELTHFAKKEPARREDIANIEDGTSTDPNTH